MSEARRRATYADLEALPENVVGEIIAGELYASPRPAGPHTAAASAMGADINGPFHRDRGGPRGPGGWWILFEPELHLAEDVVVPDLAGWRRERLPGGPRVVAFTVSPDWVCEVVSPSSTRIDRVLKMEVYLRAEIDWAWIVDPLARTLEVYRREGAVWVYASRFEGDAPVRVDPFAEVELEIARWWLPA